MQDLGHHQPRALSSRLELAPARGDDDQRVDRRQRHPVDVGRGPRKLARTMPPTASTSMAVRQVTQQPAPDASQLELRGVAHVPTASLASFFSTTRDHSVAPSVMISSLKS